MAHSRQTRATARSLYVHQRHALQTIALTLGVNNGTVSRWRTEAREKGDDWDIARAAAMMSDEGFDKLVADAVEGFTVMFQATMGQIQSDEGLAPADKAKMMASLADSFNKMINSAGRASPALSRLGVAADVLMRLGEFVHERFPQHGEIFVDVLENFTPELGKLYNETS